VDILGAKVRGVMSVEAPGAQGTMMVIDLVGQSVAPLFAGSTRIAREHIRRKAKIPTAGPRELCPGLYIRRNILILIAILLKRLQRKVTNA